MIFIKFDFACCVEVTTKQGVSYKVLPFAHSQLALDDVESITISHPKHFTSK